MAQIRQLVLLPAPAETGDTDSLGARGRLLDELARYNTAPDGAPENLGVAFGPGFRVELPFVGDRDPVAQALITITEEDSAWPVLFRMCRERNWRLMDAQTGRTFGV